jgi:hypothetical protein
MSKVSVVAENVHLSELFPSQLTTDCHYVFREDGTIDVVKAYRKADIFDTYYDINIPLKEIRISGGTLNPRTKTPEL